MKEQIKTLSLPINSSRFWPRVGRTAGLLTLLVGVVALLPRIVGLDDFITIDEVAHWIDRTQRFSDGLAAGRLQATHQTGHPGVTLMWLASLGLVLQRMALFNGWVSVDSQLELLAWLRAPVALFQSLLIPLAYLLLRRLVRPATALVAALLWAAAPLLVAHGRLLHLDGLLASFVTLSLLLLLVGLRSAPAAGSQDKLSLNQLVWIGLAGLCAGLAMLTKAPALILLPATGLLLLWRVPAHSPGQRLRRTLLLYALWLSIAVLTVVLLYPALWVAPGRVIHSYIEEIVDNGGRPNGAGQFFMGRAVDDPGSLFYAVSSALRITPLTLFGLLALAGCEGWRRLRRRPLDPAALQELRTLGALAACALLWFAVMTAGPKKFDRYVLPAWPTLELLAASGLVMLVSLNSRRPPGRLHGWISWWRRVFGPQTLVVLVLALQLGRLAFYHPYYLSYYNPLLGGGATAQRLLLIGWGEGMDRVGASLSARPDIAYGPVLAALPPTLRPFVPVPVKPISELDRGSQNYAVVYLEAIQRGADPEVYAAIMRTLPLERITIHGIDYALIYQLPKPYKLALPAQFGPALHLWGLTVEQQPGQIVVTPAWDLRGVPAADYFLFLHLLDESGRQVAQIDLPPGGDTVRPTSHWQPGQQIAVPLPLPLPENLPPGTYQLTLGLYDPASGERLPLNAGPAADPTRAGPHALLVESVVINP